jgi:tRNA (guanine37-N1)-methyltransferase
MERGTKMRLKEMLRGIVPEASLCRLSDGYHVIGDIAVLSLAPELEGYKNEIASALLNQCNHIHTVLNKTSRLQGEERVAHFEVLAGTGNTITAHKEFGFIYHLDVARVFFNSRLGSERMRVADTVKDGEDVLVPFAGSGPFVVPMAARGAHVVALEKNRDACLWLAENARQNRVQDRIAVINGDAFQMAELLKADFDRVVVPTPYGMDRIIKTASQMVNAGGWLHFYTFKKRHQIEELQQSYEDLGLVVMQCRRCGNVAPGVSRWVFDMVKS